MSKISPKAQDSQGSGIALTLLMIEIRSGEM